MPAGRPRSEAARDAILSATREELAERGYDRLSIDRVALRAGVAKQTVYRWYPSKDELVADCLLRGFVVTPSVPLDDSGDLRADVRQWMRDFVAVTHDPQAVALIRAAGAAAGENREIARGFQQQMNSMARSALTARLTAAVDSGQLRPDTPASTVAETLVGSLLYRLVTHEEITLEFVDELARIVFTGVESQDV